MLLMDFSREKKRMYTPEQKRRIEQMAEKYSARWQGRFRLVWSDRCQEYILYRYDAHQRLANVDRIADEKELEKRMGIIALQVMREKLP